MNSALNLQWLFLRDPSQRSDTVVKMNARRLEMTLAPLEARLGEQAHVLASGFSAADTMLGFNLDAAPRYVRMDPYPNIRAYADRMAARPAHARALALNGDQAFYARDFYEVGA